MSDYDKIWLQKKEDILNGINKLIQKGSVDKEVLNIMKELTEKTQIRQSIEEFSDEQLN